jgi:thiamine pyrophosphate-dependent acetolactate synthase large subunit-like protein
MGEGAVDITGLDEGIVPTTSAVPAPPHLRKVDGSRKSSEKREPRLRRVSVVVLGSEPSFLRSVSEVFAHFDGEKLGSAWPATTDVASLDPRLAEVVRSYREDAPVRLHFVASDDPEEVANAVHAEDSCVYMVVVDGRGEDETLAGIEQRIAGLYEALEALGVTWKRNAHSVVVYTRRPAVLEGAAYSHRYINRVCEPGRGVAPEDLAALTMDMLDFGALNRRAFRPKKPVTIAKHLCDFLSARGEWDAYYFTGSVISSFIDTVEAHRFQTGGRFCVSGPNEHSLACGAMANKIVFDREFLIAMTSGMADELKGTLANLRDANAKGIIVCAESAEGTWFPFQGTRHGEEDMLAAYEARGITARYLSDPATYEEDLSEALAHYETGRGPLALFVRAEILRSTREGELPRSNVSLLPTRPSAWHEAADRVVDWLNNEPTRVLWQCGPLDDQAREVLLEIMHKTGIAATDSLARPGTVPHYVDGERVEGVLGGLSLYGFSSDVYRYLHDGAKLRGKNELMMGFLSSKIAQISTPFPLARLEKRSTVLQVNHEASHIAPCTELACVADVGQFLQYVRDRLNVRPDVRWFRRLALREARDTAPDLPGQIETSPMTTNFFFERLGATVGNLIENRGYRYRGVYDVGRNGISAYRNVPRTDTGFSGWYGRALMGDAWLSLIGLTPNVEGNVMAVIGDGARAMQPDILPFLLENLNHHQARLNNLTVFIMVNGQYGLISSYQERFQNYRARRQMRSPWTPPAASRTTVGSFVLRQETLEHPTEAQLEELLLAERHVNVISIPCANNSVSDGMSLVTMKGWSEALA